GDGNGPEPSPVPGGRADFVLAASWQPGFCETKPGKTECGNQTESRFDASNFALHGLWPQPRGNEYCQVTPGEAAAAKDRRWSALPELMLDADTRTELDKVMPGSQSHLDRYEWIKHGTCYGDTVEEYYSDSLAVMAALNGSAVRELFASRIGQQVTVEEIRNAFDNSFGAGAGDRVTVSCTRDGGRRIITELQINLTGEIVDADSFVQNLVAAPSRDPGCPSGIVDAVGLQ
ncbi:MAG TPA: ribonuclease, partial [Rhizobiaceae bacterium]|nr:ribonuclease [Rhizobiaceae bacterium]